GAGSGNEGVAFTGGAGLVIQNCVIRNFQSNGIRAVTGTASNLSLMRTLVADNGGTRVNVNAGFGGIYGGMKPDRDENNNAGIAISGNGGTVNLTLRDAHIHGNATTGISSTGAGASIRVANSTTTANGTGWSSASGGAVISYGDNNLDGNTADGAATST